MSINTDVRRRFSVAAISVAVVVASAIAGAGAASAHPQGSRVAAAGSRPTTAGDGGQPPRRSTSVFPGIGPHTHVTRLRDESGAHQRSATRGPATTGSAPVGPKTMNWGGGQNGGQGVVSGKPRVYVVFYGSQWGAQSADANGNLTFSNDPDSAAAYAQNLFRGIGTGGELWSGTMTQYCDGPTVPVGATACPAGAPHIGYPTGGAFAGSWYDNAAPESANTTGADLGNVALAAAAHFGNTTAASNRYVQYVILSPTGLDPAGVLASGDCGWHSAVSSAGTGWVAYTNMPYSMDANDCGKGSVNKPGILDGYGITLGHEYAETLTDMYPDNGWVGDINGARSGAAENGDECAWTDLANVVTAHGTFAMQPTWSNDTNTCAISHPVVGAAAGSNTVTVANPGNQTAAYPSSVSLQIHAADTGSGSALYYSATGLPRGVSINRTTGVISGQVTYGGTYSITVTAADDTGASGSAAFTLTVPGNTITAVTHGTWASNRTGRAGYYNYINLQGTDSSSTATLTYSAASLPPGITLSAAGELDVMQTTAVGTYTINWTVTDNTGASDSNTVTWVVKTQPTVTNPGAQSGTVGTAANLQINATDSDSSATPLTYSATGLPAGLSINATTGLISGTPTSAGTANVTVTAVDRNNFAGSATFTWTESAANTVTVTNPGNQSGTVGTAASVPVKASDSSSTATLTYSASGLPAGLAINASTGLISGTPTAAGTSTVTVTATDSTGVTGKVTFTFVVVPNCSGQLLQNAGFESGSTPWASTPQVLYSDGAHAHTGSGYAWLDGYSGAHTDTLSQQVTIPAGCKAVLTYYLRTGNASADSNKDSSLTVSANGTNLQALSNLDATTGWTMETVDLSGYAGKTVTIQWTGVETAALNTSFYLDDTAVNLSSS